MKKMGGIMRKRASEGLCPLDGQALACPLETVVGMVDSICVPPFHTVALLISAFTVVSFHTVEPFSPKFEQARCRHFIPWRRDFRPCFKLWGSHE